MVLLSSHWASISGIDNHLHNWSRKMYRSIACVLFAAGALSLLAAVERTAQAVYCGTPGNAQEGYICVYAHHVNPLLTGIYSCGYNTEGVCSPHPGSMCGFNGYGIATPGYCAFDATPEYSITKYCYENYGSTFVPLHWYGSTCAVQNGVCRCSVWKDTDVPVQFAETCTCLGTSQWN